MIVQRDNIGLFGRVNVGKSTIMNLLTQQECSIVDVKPGTTADIKSMPAEIHGLGPVNLFDTAGIDEDGVLGEKKRTKTFNCLRECDLALLAVNPSSEDFAWEEMIMSEAKKLGKQLLVIFNVFDEDSRHGLFNSYKSIGIKAIDTSCRQPLLEFILNNFKPGNKQFELLPFIEEGQFYVLNIPMDEETPQGRLLRPQQMVEEYITRRWAYPVSYRMNLSKARKGDADEKNRFEEFIQRIKPKAIITDSQAMDIMAKWVFDDIMLTTFSIVMINHMSRGRLDTFVEGVKALDTLKIGDKVLIAEACNHSRISEDIGTVQIPRYLKEYYPGVIVEHSFGREFPANLKEYKLIIHCGGCMIDSQKLGARLEELGKAGVSITNYGIFLAAINGKEALDRVLRPWRLKSSLALGKNV